MNDKPGRSILEQCIPPGSPQSVYVAGETVGYAKAMTELMQRLPAEWMNLHGGDKGGVGLWMLQTINDIRSGK